MLLRSWKKSSRPHKNRRLNPHIYCYHYQCFPHHHHFYLVIPCLVNITSTHSCTFMLSFLSSFSSIICFAAYASMLCILYSTSYYRSNTNNGDFGYSYHAIVNDGEGLRGEIFKWCNLDQCLPGTDTSSSILHLPTSRIASASPVSSSGASSKELTIAHGSFPPPYLRISRLYFSPVSRLSGS